MNLNTLFANWKQIVLCSALRIVVKFSYNMNLSNEERIEVLELYGGNSARLTADIFNERHPERNRSMSHATVLKI